MRVDLRQPSERQLARLGEELAEVGLVIDGTQPWHQHAVDEIDYALRPRVHERRVPSYGAILAPSTAQAEWERATSLHIDVRAAGATATAAARRYADGQSSWLVRQADGDDAWAVFDRPAGSERDLVVLAEAMAGVVVQRHPNGAVRIVGPFGVLRWNGLTWHHERLVSSWFDVVNACTPVIDPDTLETLLEFAVHDLGARGIGAILLYRADAGASTAIELRLPPPPPLDLRRPSDLAPLRHALAQLDGAAVIDHDGILRELGVRLVPSPEAESSVEGFRGMRHTSGRRYSFDDPAATVIVISEDGPVTVLRNGELIGRSRSVNPP
jgi:hypothetical protein